MANICEVWKTAIHLADFEPGGHEKHREAERLLDALKRKHVNSMEVADYCLLTLRFLEQSPAYQRRCQRDIIDAFAKVCPYFPNQKVASISKFLETEEGKLFKDSALFKEERANAIPDKRSHTSNCYMPKDFFNEWDGRLKVVGNSGRDDVPIFAPDKYPTEWDVGIRPILAKCEFIIATRSKIHSLKFSSSVQGRYHLSIQRTTRRCTWHGSLSCRP